MSKSDWRTPFEAGNGDHTTTLADCVAFYERLAAAFPQVLRLHVIGQSDGGLPLHAGIVTADGEFDRATLHAQARPIFFNNNGIHPGEPEGIDACMALVRDLCTQPERRAALGRTVFLFIPVYNVDGCRNRGNTSRVNQQGPQAFGFRGNDLHLDLNRDFIKCDSRNARAFNRFFSAWRPHVMVDTHTSNGADYRYTMTLIPTQPDKLGGPLGAHLRQHFLPAIYAGMRARGWPTCPYVNPVAETPDDGIADFLETPRFSTGYAALHHCIGFMPESHMLKPYADRYAAMQALVAVCLDWTVQHGHTIDALRQQQAAQQPAPHPAQWPLRWAIDLQRSTPLAFEGYAAVYEPSRIGHYQRLRYDRSRPWQRDIAHYHHATVLDSVPAVAGYLIPQAWRHAIARLQDNGLQLQRLTADQTLPGARVWHIHSASVRPCPYEGRNYHDELHLQARHETVHAHAGDYWLPLHHPANQPAARYAVEVLEPLAHDSLLRWGFFDSVLERKEHYAHYVFEDTAAAMLQAEAPLRAQFHAWAAQDPTRLQDQRAVLDFIYHHGQRHAEPGWRRYPIYGLPQPPAHTQATASMD